MNSCVIDCHVHPRRYQEAKDIIKFAVKQLTGMKKRVFMAEVSKKLCYGSPRLAETEFGWNRKAVQLGINEQRTGLECFGHYEVRGKRRSEVDQPRLEQDIRSLIEPESQADPRIRFQRNEPLTTFSIVWATSFAGYRKPSLKKIPETCAIFENVHRVNEDAKNNKKVLRVSMDCKVTINLGDFSRGGKSRGTVPVKALDHDMATKSKLIPFGILNLENDQLYFLRQFEQNQ